MLASIFADGERVDIIGTGRGKGFQGVVKRHHFAGGAATHGSMFHRAPGSIGASSFPSRVVKGMRAAGRMGGGRVTIHNLKVLRVDPDNHLLIVEGGIPGRADRLRDRPQGGHGEEDQGRAGREAEEGQEVATVSQCQPSSNLNSERRMQLDVVNNENEKVGAVDVRDEVFGGRVNDRPDLGIGRARQRRRAARHARDQEPRPRQRQRQEAVAAEGHRPRARRRRSATRCGARAAPCSGRSRAATTSRCRRRSSAARCARRSRQKLKDGALVVVDALTAGEIKTKAAAELLKRLGVDGKAVLIDVALDEKLARSVRNIPGVSLVPSARLTARDVIDAGRVVATRGALEKLQEALG